MNRLNPASDIYETANAIACDYSIESLFSLFSNSIVIFSAPRSGSTLLFETLQTSNDIWTIGGESHFIFNSFSELHPATTGFKHGAALSAQHANNNLCHRMRAMFLSLLIDNKGGRYLDISESARPKKIYFLEKTPRNALNIPFMRKLFPHMKAIFLYRNARENIASIMEAWEVGMKSGRFVTFRNLPNWDKSCWCLLLPRSWQKMRGKSIAEIAAFQWHAANRTILDDLTNSDLSWMPIDYQSLVDDPVKSMEKLAIFSGIAYAGALKQRAESKLPLSNTIVTAPKRDKWKRHEKIINEIDSMFSSLESELMSLPK